MKAVDVDIEVLQTESEADINAKKVAAKAAKKAAKMATQEDDDDEQSEGELDDSNGTKNPPTKRVRSSLTDDVKVEPKKRISRGKGQTDLYETPVWVSQIIVSLLREKFNFNTGTVFEPAAGNLAISNVLLSHGYNVISRDKNKMGWNEFQHDYLEQAPPDYDVLVTNPPPSQAREFLRQVRSNICKTTSADFYLFFRLFLAVSHSPCFSRPTYFTPSDAKSFLRIMDLKQRILSLLLHFFIKGNVFVRLKELEFSSEIFQTKGVEKFVVFRQSSSPRKYWTIVPVSFIHSRLNMSRKKKLVWSLLP